MSQMTQQEALETFEYKDGMLYWKKHVQANKYVGKPVGSVCKLGYYNTRHKNVNYKDLFSWFLAGAALLLALELTLSQTIWRKIP
jgi:hypothetical protein